MLKGSGKLAGLAVFLVLAFLTVLSSAAPATAQEKRRVAMRIPQAWLSGPEMQRLIGWGRRSGIEIDVGAESAPVPPGWEAVFVGIVPASAALRRRLERFPFRL